MDHHFGISTHLFHESRLAREHLIHIRAHGFEAIELFATRSHFDYQNDHAIHELADWLSETGLRLHSVHAPIFSALKDGQWVGPMSNATSDEARRSAAVSEAAAAVALSRRLPYQFLVVHLGVPTSAPQGVDDNQPSAARRSLEQIAALGDEAGVRVAVEVIPNALSTPQALVRMIEEDLDGLDVGICLDFGHAHLIGDLGEAIETVGGHLWTTHVHDNGGRTDDHLAPFAGTIHWDSAMMETQKIGYDGLLMLEVAGIGDPLDVLNRSAAACRRLEKTLVTF